MLPAEEAEHGVDELGFGFGLGGPSHLRERLPSGAHSVPEGGNGGEFKLLVGGGFANPLLEKEPRKEAAPDHSGILVSRSRNRRALEVAPQSVGIGPGEPPNGRYHS